MGRPPFRRAAAIAASCALLLAACGDDDTTAAGTTTTDAEMAETDGSGHGHGEGIEVGDADEIPSVAIDARPDPKAGVNLRIQTTGFRFAPEHASSSHVPGEGHAHVYVDGEKVGRAYTEWLHLDVAPGEHEIRVEVNANDHSPLLVDGEPIEASATVDVPEPASGHSHTEGFAAAEPHPTVALEVVEDAKSGWNLHLVTTGFTFAPEKASTMQTTSGEGHAHLYVDGRKIGRVYGEWFHLDEELGGGEHEVRVELSANDHSPYLADGEPIEATATIAVDREADEPGAEADADADQVVEVTVTGADVQGGGRHAVALGDTVSLVVHADTEDEIHVHGYELLADVGPGRPAVVTFDADLPGVWEVELHDSGTVLVELEVR